MTDRTPPKLATILLRSLGPANDALAGDLREACLGGKSAWWYWGQVLMVLGTEMFRMVRPSLGWSSAATVAVLILLEGPLLFHVPAPSDGSGWLMVALYLAPQALIIAVPVGFMLGMLADPPSQKRRPVGLAMMSAAILSVIVFAVAGWLVPSSNQAYRVTVGGPGALRGAAELTFFELHSLMTGAGDRFRIAPISDDWNVAVNYYARLALSCAPVAFALLGVWTAKLRLTARRVAVLATVAVYLAYVFVAPGAFRSVPPVIVAWMPVMTVLVAAVVSRALSRDAAPI